MSTVIHLFLLGEFQILSGGMPITALDRRFQSLLAYLALHRTVPQTRRNLAFLFWSDSSEEQAHTNLRNLLHKLRREWPVSDHLLRIERQTLQWLPTVPWTLDVSTFEQALLEIEQATQARLPDKLQAALKNAIACYRGDLLPHWYEEWLQPEREHLRQRFLQALERLLVLQEEHRDYSAAIETTERLLRSDPLNADTAIPPTVQTIIARRLRSLSPSARDLASLAATIGRAFSFSVLAEACRSDEAHLVLDLDELWQRRIIREQGEEAYHFSHEKLRKGALATLSKARQRLLHQQIARALAVVYAETLDQISGEIAFHYVRANLPQLAVSYLERAGDWAYQIFAHAEATRFYQELAGHLNQLKRYAERALALEKGARSLGAQAHYQQALENLEQALAWYQATGNFEDQARVVAKTGQLQASQGAVLILCLYALLLLAFSRLP